MFEIAIIHQEKENRNKMSNTGQQIKFAVIYKTSENAGQRGRK